MTHQINYAYLGPAGYDALRYQLLHNVEETNAPSSQPYVDCRGFVTIGVGFNLHDPAIRRAVLDSWGIAVGSAG
jgi:hypothetical protein